MNLMDIHNKALEEFGTMVCHSRKWFFTMEDENNVPVALRESFFQEIANLRQFAKETIQETTRLAYSSSIDNASKYLENIVTETKRKVLEMLVIYEGRIQGKTITFVGTNVDEHK